MRKNLRKNSKFLLGYVRRAVERHRATLGSCASSTPQPRRTGHPLLRFAPGALEVESLLAQHIRETGQAFTAEARAAVQELTRGQPWLVNALAYEACFDNRAGRDRGRATTDDVIQDAREQ